MAVSATDIKQEPSSPQGCPTGGRKWGEGEKGACLYEGRGRPATAKKDVRNDIRYEGHFTYALNIAILWIPLTG